MRFPLHVADKGHADERRGKRALLRKLCRHGACEELRLRQEQGEPLLFPRFQQQGDRCVCGGKQPDPSVGDQKIRIPRPARDQKVRRAG